MIRENIFLIGGNFYITTGKAEHLDGEQNIHVNGYTVFCEAYKICTKFNHVQNLMLILFRNCFLKPLKLYILKIQKKQFYTLLQIALFRTYFQKMKPKNTKMKVEVLTEILYTFHNVHINTLTRLSRRKFNLSSYIFIYSLNTL